MFEADNKQRPCEYLRLFMSLHSLVLRNDYDCCVMETLSHCAIGITRKMTGDYYCKIQSSQVAGRPDMLGRLSRDPISTRTERVLEIIWGAQNIAHTRQNAIEIFRMGCYHTYRSVERLNEAEIWVINLPRRAY